MQDKEYGQIAAALRELTGIDGVYKVIEADEILEKLPAGSRPDKQRLSAVRPISYAPRLLHSTILETVFS